jgi:hypothetical protein
MRLGSVTSRIGAILVTGGLFVALTAGTALAAQGSPNGAASQRPVFYEGKQVTVNMFEVPASEALLEHNRSTNTIYASNVAPRVLSSTGSPSSQSRSSDSR